MNQKNRITVIMIITVLLALLLFFINDNSGLSVTDCLLQSDDDNSYNLTYTLRVGRHFNRLDCHYTLYSEDNNVISDKNVVLEDVYLGTFPISDIIQINNTTKAKKAEITIDVQVTDNENKTSMQRAYTKTFDL